MKRFFTPSLVLELGLALTLLIATALFFFNRKPRYDHPPHIINFIEAQEQFCAQHPDDCAALSSDPAAVTPISLNR